MIDVNAIEEAVTRMEHSRVTFEVYDGFTQAEDDYRAAPETLRSLVGYVRELETALNREVNYVEAVRDAIAYGGHDYFQDCRPDEVYVPIDDIRRAVYPKEQW